MTRRVRQDIAERAAVFIDLRDAEKARSGNIGGGGGKDKGARGAPDRSPGDREVG